MGMFNDQELIQSLHRNEEEAIENIFRQYYSYICSAVYNIIPDSNLVEDLSQEVFYELWKKRERIKINSSLKAYLRRAAINKSLNHIRKKKIKFDSDDTLIVKNLAVRSGENKLEAQDLQKIINKTLDLLPEKCRIIFMMSRHEEMSYREIATELDISIKTVENHISKALKLMREAVNPYLAKEMTF